ncbi:MAG: hypothetical protein ACO24T_06780 [Hylemonella sp.]
MKDPQQSESASDAHRSDQSANREPRQKRKILGKVLENLDIIAPLVLVVTLIILMYQRGVSVIF